MKYKCAIAVSQCVVSYPDRREVRDALDQNLCLWIEAVGGFPVPVPNILGKSQQSFDVWLTSISPAAIVLSGGNDVGEVDDRDNTERMLLDYAKDRQLPLLGICRGMQMMGVYAGVALMNVSGHVATRHSVQGQIEGDVNSFHHWSLDSCPDGFIATAIANDGVIEAIKHQVLPWEGWMWHPERENPFWSNDMQRAKKLLIDQGN